MAESPPPIDWTKFVLLYGKRRAMHIMGRYFMRRMGLSADIFYRRVREDEVTHGIAEPTSLDGTRQRNGKAPQHRPTLQSVKLTV